MKSLLYTYHYAVYVPCSWLANGLRTAFFPELTQTRRYSL